MTARLTCEQAAEQFFAYLDRALAGQPLQDFERHLAECLDCCDRVQFNRRLDGFVKERLGEEALPQGLEDRLRQGLMRARAGQTTEES